MSQLPAIPDKRGFTETAALNLLQGLGEEKCELIGEMLLKRLQSDDVSYSIHPMDDNEDSDFFIRGCRVAPHQQLIALSPDGFTLCYFLDSSKLLDAPSYEFRLMFTDGEGGMSAMILFLIFFAPRVYGMRLWRHLNPQEKG